jgi:Fe2+ transport system protein FeoA
MLCLYRNPLNGPLVLQADNYEFSLKQNIANRINISVIKYRYSRCLI